MGQLRPRRPTSGRILHPGNQYAYIDHVGDRLPIEFQVLGYRPKKWRPEDCLGRMSVLPVAFNLRREVARAELVACNRGRKGTAGDAHRPQGRLRTGRGARPVGRRRVAVGRATGRSARQSTSWHNMTAEFVGRTRKSNGGTGILPVILAQHWRDASATQFQHWRDASATQQRAATIGRSTPRSRLPASRCWPATRTAASACPRSATWCISDAPGWNVIGAGEPALPGVAIGHNRANRLGASPSCSPTRPTCSWKNTHPDDHSSLQGGRPLGADAGRPREDQRTRLAAACDRTALDAARTGDPRRPPAASGVRLAVDG